PGLALRGSRQLEKRLHQFRQVPRHDQVVVAFPAACRAIPCGGRVLARGAPLLPEDLPEAEDTLRTGNYGVEIRRREYRIHLARKSSHPPLQPTVSGNAAHSRGPRRELGGHPLPTLEPVFLAPGRRSEEARAMDLTPESSES